MNFFSQVSSLLSKRDKKLFTLLFILSFIVSVFESISISAMMFFISTVTNFNFIEQTRYYKYLNSIFNFSSASKFILFLGIVVGVLYVVRAFLNFFHIFATNNLAIGKGRTMALRVYSDFLGFYYTDFTANNSAHISQALFSDCNALASVCLGFVNLMSEFLTFICIYLMLLWVNFSMTLSLTVCLAAISICVVKLFSKELSVAGRLNQKNTEDMCKVFSEAFWNFKLIKLHGNKDTFATRFSVANSGVLKANVFNNVLQSLPRFLLETLGFLILVLMVIYVIFVYKNPAFIIPIVSVYALALYRFLPSINKVLTSYNQIIFNKAAVIKLYEYLKTKPEELGNEKIYFKKKIELKQVLFYYNESRIVLDKADLTVYKGQRVGLVGPSGSGKSTLADLIMGILHSCGGQILIDGQALTCSNLSDWRSKIGYIPQQIYLFDGSVAENVVFGRSYDHQKLIHVLKKANIYEFLLTQDGLETRVGEGGVKLSGGQKQRIAIARALYGDPDVLVLDEATSALDSNTEDLIMSEIYKINEDKTLIVIAHRLSTIEKCDIVYKVADGKILIDCDNIINNRIYDIRNGLSC